MPALKPSQPPPVKKPRPTRKPSPLPVKPVLEEIVFARGVFRELIAKYSADTEVALAEVLAQVTALARQEAPSKERVPDLRDMLMILRELDVKPAKGRRRDFKKIETIIEDLREITAKW